MASRTPITICGIPLILIFLPIGFSAPKNLLELVNPKTQTLDPSCTSFFVINEPLVVFQSFIAEKSEFVPTKATTLDIDL